MVSIIKKICLISFLLAVAHLSSASQKTAELENNAQATIKLGIVQNSDQDQTTNVSNELAKMLEIELQPISENQFNY
jgi:hypothetical protein